MIDNFEVVTVVRNKAMYEQCIANNPFLKNTTKHLCDNTAENKSIPHHYNNFLESFDFDRPAWIMFCHEDFEVQCDLPERLSKCDKNFLYGPIGARKRTLIPGALCRWQVVGSIDESDKDGNNLKRIGLEVPFATTCDTFDCCCILVHSSLLKKTGLRFDERMEFDLYVEDFCIQAKVMHGIGARILAMPSVHKSCHKTIPPSYLAKLEIANQKWPDVAFAGSTSWIGGDIAGRYFEGVFYGVAKKFVGNGDRR